jgi:hypothetical protein
MMWLSGNRFSGGWRLAGALRGGVGWVVLEDGRGAVACYRTR